MKNQLKLHNFVTDSKFLSGTLWYGGGCVDESCIDGYPCVRRHLFCQVTFIFI